MELKAYERIKFANNLRPLLIKDECECCGETDTLHLHHDKQFAQMLKETLDRLGYEYKLKKEDYTREQLENITDMLLGAHIKSTFTTLCEKCHIEIHRNGELAVNYLFRKSSERIKIEKELDKIDLKNLLNQMIGIKIFKEEQYNFKQSLFKLLHSPKERNGSVGLKVINNFIEEHNLPYLLISKKETIGNMKDKRYWIIYKVTESEEI